MKQKNSVWGIMSLAFIITCALLLILNVIVKDLSKYIFHPSLQLPDSLETLLGTGIGLTFLSSFITGITALFIKNTKKIFPTISVSITIFILLIVAVEISEPLFNVITIKYGVVTNYGIFDIPLVKLENGTTLTLYEQRSLKKNTDEIPAKIGTRFGINYVISGDPDEEAVLIKKIINYPRPGLVKNGKTTFADTTEIYVNLNELTYSGYVFEYDYELIPGKWEIEYFYKNRKLFSQEFIVIKEKTNII